MSDDVEIIKLEVSALLVEVDLVVPPVADVAVENLLTRGVSSANPPLSISPDGTTMSLDLVVTPPLWMSSDGTTISINLTGYVQAAPPTTFNQLAGFADPPDGTLIQGVDLPAS